MKKMKKELNEIIEMLKTDHWYYAECKSLAIERDMGDTFITFYSNILKY